MNLKNLYKNYLTTGIYIITKIIINFVYMRLIITQYGSAINGYFSSVIGIMGYLNIAEAGVGFATTYALYKPIYEKDYEKCNSVLSFTNHYYRKVGIILTIVIILLSVIYPNLVKDFDNKSLGTFIILVYGTITLTEYFYDGKYRVLLHADQKLYTSNIIATTSYILSYGTFIVLILLKKNFFIVSSTLLLGSLIRIASAWVISKRRYPWINFKVSPDRSIWKYSNDLFFQKLASLAFSSTDILLISLVVGVKEVSVYSVYNAVLNGLNSSMTIITEAPVHIFGQLFAGKDLLKAKKIYYVYEHLTIIITTIITSCWFLLINSFIKLYTMGVYDINYNNQMLAVLIGLYFMLTNYRTTAATVLNVTGEFNISKKVYITEAIINIIFSAVLVFQIGILGVVLGSVIARVYSLFTLVKISYKKLLRISFHEFLKKILINIFIVLVFFILGNLLIISVPNYLQFIVYGLLALVITSILTVSVNYFFWKEDTVIILNRLRKILIRKK